jgi:hypothetical protein
MQVGSSMILELFVELIRAAIRPCSKFLPTYSPVKGFEVTLLVFHHVASPLTLKQSGE